MKILFCNYEYPPLGGGGGVINALLAEELAKQHEVTVLTSQGLGLPLEEISNNVRLIRVPVFFRTQLAAANMPSMFAYLPMGIHKGKAILKAESFDVINTHFVLPTGPVGNSLSNYAKIPNVVSVHGGDLYDPSKTSSPHRHWLLRQWIKKLLRNADAVVGQSTNTLENMHNYYTPEIAGIRIPLGINRPPREAGNRSDYKLRENDILLVTVGRLVARKAIDQLIDAVARLNNPQVKLLIMGSGPQEKMLRNKAKECHINEQIHFLGQVDETEKFRILNMADAFVSSSQHEGFGIVFLEAMACGLPVICYDHGGQTDFLVDGHTGFLVPLNHTDVLTDRCKQLVDDPSMRGVMSQENLKRIEQLFIEHCATQYEEVFNNVIEQNKLLNQI